MSLKLSVRSMLICINKLIHTEKLNFGFHGVWGLVVSFPRKVEILDNPQRHLAVHSQRSRTLFETSISM